MAFWAAAAPALISAAGSIAGGLLGSSGQQAANAQNALLQQQLNQQQLAFQGHWNQKSWDQHVADRNFQQDWAVANMTFQERMANTAYQRTMADMKSGGLNPILAYKQGSASAPGGSMPGGAGGGFSGVSLDAPTMQNESAELGRAIGGATASALQASQMKEGIDLTREQTNNQASQTELNKANDALAVEMTKKATADTAVSAAQFVKTTNEADLARENTFNAKVQNAILGHGVTSAHGEARIKTREAEDAEKYGTGTWAQRGGFLERLGRRLMGTINERSPPPGGASPQANPIGAPRGMLRDDPSHWLYKPRPHGS